MSKAIAVGIALCVITVLLAIASTSDFCDGCIQIDKSSAIIGGGFIGGTALIYIGYRRSQRNEFLENLDDTKDKILKDVKKALDKI